MNASTTTATTTPATSPNGHRRVKVELEAISKSFGGVAALQDVSVSLSDGEIVAMVGDNGAGKSTLLKILAGVHQAESGRILIDGQECRFSEPRDAKAHGIEVVYQDLALVNRQSVYMNMFLGREAKRGVLRTLDKPRMRRETRAILDELEIQLPSPDAEVKRLSGGQRQGIAIGRAVHWASRLVLMDEPTAALGVTETQRVERIIEHLRERGLAVLLVSHNLDQVFRLADRVYVLRRGHLVGERETSETDPDDVVALITGVRSDTHFA
jgi:ABC-type sugar transport system ATPase subunit